MFRIALVFFVFGTCFGFAGTRDIPESVRKEYAKKFHEAFVVQCNGQSTKAFWILKEASQQALDAGEEPLKVQLIGTLFRWYRTHGSLMSLMKLFLIEPTGSDIIYPDGTRLNKKSSNSYNYQSEYGRTPEQAAKTREFMCGVGSTIAGIFFVVVGGVTTPIGGIGVTLAATGFYMMFSSLNNAYSDYERSKLELKTIEDQAKRACTNDR
jgi:hypothetical protein